ncbi:Bug family tripartite tricarboxylate transporter substrate binding protein [Comamonas thiooxydans]|uniref:Bug family tripartite tricarboxylate transporter substrate binding protein n=1 Tax=Comamonas thiooxydans TaxID=363952 RepID=UPI00050F60F0|nr:tripartite tricarboxylate transporter substrate binding protein [Comamonas thiooxydans]KGH21300.1 MFS transporter [Comamonas thiooxydans]
MRLFTGIPLRASVFGAALGTTFLLATGASHAQGYPNRPVKLVLGFAPAGPTDVVARMLAERMAQTLGQPIVIENRPGAGGNLAAEALVKAPADGYTLLYNTSSITIAPWVYQKVNYDPIKDFVPIGLTAEMPLVLLVNPQFPAKDAKSLVAEVKSRPGKYSYGSSGVGAIEHLTGAHFANQRGLDATHVPYKGTAPALIDLLGGQTQYMMTTLNTAVPYIKEGRLNAYGVTSKARTQVLPSVPTISELFNENFVATAWQGIVAPAGTPPEVIEKVNRAINLALKDPSVLDRLAKQGVSPLGGSAQQYAEQIRSELDNWRKVVAATGAKID